jgi:hypothetical protein
VSKKHSVVHPKNTAKGEGALPGGLFIPDVLKNSRFILPMLYGLQRMGASIAFVAEKREAA